MANPTLAERILAMTDDQIDDMAFGYVPSGKIGELREFARALLAEAAAMVEQAAMKLPVATWKERAAVAWPDTPINHIAIRARLECAEEEIADLRAALAAEQEGQEAVAWMIQDAADVEIPGTGTCKFSRDNPADYGYGASNVTPLYTHRAAQEGDAPNWISVDECLPPDGDDVIAWAGDHIVIERWEERHECPVGWSSATIPIGPAWDDHEFEDISHWMPLPDAPASTTNQKG